MAASITFNGKELTHKIDILQQRQIPFIAALTISGRKKGDESLASQVKKDLLLEMQDSFKQIAPQTKWLFDTPKARKNSLKTVISHKEDAAKGQSAADYLGPQIVGGRVLETEFQTRLKGQGYISNSSYMLPLHNAPGAKVRGRLAPSVYNKALWGISAMEDLRGKISRKGVNIYDKKKTSSYKTKGSFIHVPENVARNNLGGKGQEQYAQMIRGFAYKKGQSWHSIPGPGIYKVNPKGKGLTQIFKTLDRVPTIKGQTYLFKETATTSVNNNVERIFRMKVREVLGS